MNLRIKIRNKNDYYKKNKVEREKERKRESRDIQPSSHDHSESIKKIRMNLAEIFFLLSFSLFFLQEGSDSISSGFIRPTQDSLATAVAVVVSLSLKR